MEPTDVCVWVVLVAVANSRAANIKYPVLAVNNSRSVAAQQSYYKDAEGKTHFGYAYNGQAAANILNADDHMVGAWSYLNPQGALVQTSYTADENGFNVVVNNLMSERSCYTIEGGLGSCMSLLSCYPTSTLPGLSRLEVSTVMVRMPCNCIKRDGTQAHGVCCPIRQSFDEFGDLSHTGRMPFATFIVVPFGFHYPTVASSLMVLANEKLRMPSQKTSSSSTQLEKAVPTNTKISCGVGPEKILGLDASYRILGGEEAFKNSWPGMVVLKRSGQFKCGGVLIAPNKVLTVHC